MDVQYGDWEALGLRPGACREEVRVAFCALARAHHPDKSAALDATARFRDVHEAYRRLMSSTQSHSGCSSACQHGAPAAASGGTAPAAHGDGSEKAAQVGCGDCGVKASEAWHEAFGMRFCSRCWQRWWQFQTGAGGSARPGGATAAAPKSSWSAVRRNRIKAKTDGKRHRRKQRRAERAAATLAASRVARSALAAATLAAAAPRHPHLIWKRSGDVGLEAVGWKRLESRSCPGNFYYFCAATGESMAPLQAEAEATTATAAAMAVASAASERPQPLAAWERIESRSKPGTFYFYNRETGESRLDLPGA